MIRKLIVEMDPLCKCEKPRVQIEISEGFLGKAILELTCVVCGSSTKTPADQLNKPGRLVFRIVSPEG